MQAMESPEERKLTYRMIQEIDGSGGKPRNEA